MIHVFDLPIDDPRKFKSHGALLCPPPPQRHPSREKSEKIDVQLEPIRKSEIGERFRICGVERIESGMMLGLPRPRPRWKAPSLPAGTNRSRPRCQVAAKTDLPSFRGNDPRSGFANLVEDRGSRASSIVVELGEIWRMKSKMGVL